MCGFGNKIDQQLVAGGRQNPMFMGLHQFCDSHAVCFDCLLVLFDLSVQFFVLILKPSNFPQGCLIFPRKLYRRKCRLTGPIDAGKRFHGQLWLHICHGGWFVTPQAPDPLIKLLEDHILFRLIPLQMWCCEVVIRIVAPDGRKCSMLHVQHRQIKSKLKLIVQRISPIRPVTCLVIGQRLTFQNTRLAIFFACKTSVNVGQRIRQMCVLVEEGIIGDEISGPLFIEVCSNRFQHMTHFQGVRIKLRFCFHAPLFDHPEFQRRCPRRKSKNGGHIASAYCILNVAFRSVLPALQPSVVVHAGTVAQNDRGGHYHFTSLAKS